MLHAESVGVRGIDQNSLHPAMCEEFRIVCKIWKRYIAPSNEKDQKPTMQD